MYGGSSTFSDSDLDSASDESDALASLSTSAVSVATGAVGNAVEVEVMAAEAEEGWAVETEETDEATDSLSLEDEASAGGRAEWMPLTIRSMRLKMWYSGIWLSIVPSPGMPMRKERWKESM